MIRVTHAEPRDDFYLVMDFTNGERRAFDMRPYLDIGVFKRLKNKQIFKQAKVAFGTVVWPGDLDIAPETLYIESVPIQGDSAI